MKRFIGRMFARAANLFGVNPSVWSAIGGMRGIGLSSAGVQVTPEAALNIAAYKRAIDLLSSHVGKATFTVMRGTTKDTRHPAHSLIRWWAQHHQLSAFEFRRVLMIHALMRGNGYAWIKREGSIPVALYLLDPAKITPKKIGDRLVYEVAGSERTISASDIIHIKGLGDNGYEGLDPIRYYAREVLGLAIATQQYASKYYENGGAPNAYLSASTPLTDEQFNRLKGEAGPLKRDIDNPHELPVLEMVDIKSVGLSAEQTQLLSARKDIMLEIANLLGIPPHKLGLATNTSYKSLEEENKAFRDDSLDPWLVQFELEFRKLLTEAEQDEELAEVVAERFSVSRNNAPDRANYLKAATGGAAWYTINDARSVENLPAVPDGDKLLQPLNMSGQNTATDPPADPAPPDNANAQRATAIHQLLALQDVLGRMSRRLSTAANQKLKRSDQLDSFAASMASHTEVIESALAPILPLCGLPRADARKIAVSLCDEFVNQVTKAPRAAEDWPEQIRKVGAEFEMRSIDYAGQILTRGLA